MALEELFHIKQRLGAVQADGDENSGRVQFRLYFPAGFDTQITGIRVAGDFQPQIGAAPWSRDNRGRLRPLPRVHNT